MGLSVNAADYAGWYEPDSPRTELSHFLGRLVRLSRVRFEDGKMISSALGRWHQVHIPVEGAQFRFEHKEAPPDPVATLELLTPNTEGRFIQTDSQTTMRRIPGWFAIGEILVPWNCRSVSFERKFALIGQQQETARKLATLIYRLLRWGQPYVDEGAAVQRHTKTAIASTASDFWRLFHRSFIRQSATAVVNLVGVLVKPLR